MKERSWGEKEALVVNWSEGAYRFLIRLARVDAVSAASCM